MKARIIVRDCTILDGKYYAIAILDNPHKREIILQTPLHTYPDGERESGPEILTEEAKNFFQTIVDKINR